MVDLTVKFSYTRCPIVSLFCEYVTQTTNDSYIIVICILLLTFTREGHSIGDRQLADWLAVDAEPYFDIYTVGFQDIHVSKNFFF